jgi:hypothetical protein
LTDRVGSGDMRYRHRVFYVGRDIRGLRVPTRLEYLPLSLADVPALMASGRMPVDVALVQVGPPDEDGMCSLGISVDVVPGYAELYRSPERLSGAGVSAADDVFAIAATVVAWATGAHAFAGATPGERDASLLTGRRASFSGPPSVALLLAAALGAAPGRPAAGALAAGLTAS